MRQGSNAVSGAILGKGSLVSGINEGGIRRPGSSVSFLSRLSNEAVPTVSPHLIARGQTPVARRNPDRNRLKQKPRERRG